MEIKSLIKPVWESYKDRIIGNSIKNCHVKGLHSIMLIDAPEQRIRLFYADNNHELYHDDEIHLAVHGHHCDVTLVGIKGHVCNILYKINPEGYRRKKYEYVSKIKTGSGSFKLVEGGTSSADISSREGLTAKVSIFMPADMLHTVQVAKGISAAWFVIEGKEDTNYESVCYTDHPDPNSLLVGLYGTMTELEVELILSKLNLI